MFGRRPDQHPRSDGIPPGLRARRAATPPPAPLAQRLQSLAAEAIGLPVGIVLAPFAIPVAAAVDLLTLRRKLPTVRLYLYVLVFLVHEWVGQSRAAANWIRRRLGADIYDADRRVQGWWAGSLIEWADRLLGLELDLQDPETMPAGDVIVISRHSSMLDAIVPAWLFAARLDRPVHYVLKRELQWVANIEVFGRRLRNHFVRRGGPDTGAEVSAITAMAAGAEPSAGLVIFPEGTYGSEANIDRIRRSLQRRGDTQLLALANELQTVLPPKPAGTLALLRAKPDADVVVFGHVGLERLADPAGLRRSIPARHPIVVRWWVHPRAEVPLDDAERISWLEDRWRELDRWVLETRAAQAAV